MTYCIKKGIKYLFKFFIPLRVYTQTLEEPDFLHIYLLLLNKIFSIYLRVASIYMLSNVKFGL